jgi:hypothetical protein
MSVHPSKVDAWLAVVLAATSVIPPLAAILMLIVDFHPWRFAVLAIAIGAGTYLPLWVLIGTRYSLEHGQLTARSGPFAWRVQVADITAVAPSHDPRSAPALSLDRLAIAYDGGRTLLISPEDSERFLAELSRMGLSAAADARPPGRR